MTGSEDHRAAETYLTAQWRKTRSTFVIRFMSRAGPLLELVHHRDECDDELSGRIAAEIEQIIKQTIGACWTNRAMWEAAVAVCPDRERLAGEIKKDKAARGFSSDVDPIRALGQILKAHLDARRREAVDVTEHQERVWTKLRRISNELISEYQAAQGRFPPYGYRCGREHFANIRRRILRDMPRDRQVGPMKTGTIEVYFARFCDECREQAFREYAEPWSDGAAELPPHLKEEMTQVLTVCVDRLDAPLRDAVHAAYRLGERTAAAGPGKPGGGAAAPDDKEFKRLKKEALRQLRVCVERGMSERRR
jgi:hypothetical protein